MKISWRNWNGNELIFTTVVLVLTILQIPGKVTSDMSATDKTMQRLLSDLGSYSHKEVRPMRNISDTLTIAVSLKLHDIISLDFEHGILTVKVTIEQVWNNYLMRWDEKAYGGIKHAVLPAHKLWLPDLSVYNSLDGNHYFHGAHVKVYYTGYTEWKSTETIRVKCDLHAANFPNDEQKCFLKIGSWVYDGVKLDVQHKSGRLTTEVEKSPESNKEYKVWKVSGLGIDLSEYTHSLLWEITKTEAINAQKFYPCCEEPYVDLTFYLSLKRKTGIYQNPETMTWILLTLLPILVFLIPVQSNQKVGVAGINFLLLLLVFTSSAGRKDSNVFLMTNFYLFTLILDFGTICGVVGVVSTYARNSQMPKILRHLLPMLGKITFVKNPHVVGNSEKMAKGKIYDYCVRFIMVVPMVYGHLTAESQSPGLQCIAKYLKEEQELEAAKSSWNCLSTILNRFFLLVTTILSVIGIVSFVF